MYVQFTSCVYGYNELEKNKKIDKYLLCLSNWVLVISLPMVYDSLTQQKFLRKAYFMVLDQNHLDLREVILLIDPKPVRTFVL